MELHVIESGSSGNCYIIGNKEEAIIIDPGVHINIIKKAMDFKNRHVQGCLMSHEHDDHSMSVEKLMQLGINCYSSAGTWKALGITKRYDHRRKTMKAINTYRLGNFLVMPFPVKHRCEDPFGFLIFHKETGKILFATDTCHIPYAFKHVKHILIECNYDLDLVNKKIESGAMDPVVKFQLLDSHMNTDTLKDYFKLIDFKHVINVVLIHMSQGNINPEKLIVELSALTRRTFYAASEGLKIELNKTIF